jgi:hypothetical protein
VKPVFVVLWVALPEKVVTLDAGNVYVKLAPLTEIGGCAASDRLADVIHGITEFVENPLKETV